jgi:ribonuclease HI
MIKIEVYTDGSCSGNPGPGGWSFVMLENELEKKRVSGSEVETTNNQMEMMAAIKAFEELEKTEFSEQISVNIISDSAYLVNAFVQDWISGWLKNGWINSRKEPVANKELWESLIHYQKKYSATFTQIKRRSNSYAIIVDAMAKKPLLNKPS